MQNVEGKWLAILVVSLGSNASSANAQCKGWGREFGPPGIDGTPFAFAVFDDGSGTSLFVGGNFTGNGSVMSRGIAKWDGASWSPVGDGVNGSVFALTVFDDGAGPALYAGGSVFTLAGGVAADRIAKWDGSSWSPLGSGVSGYGGTVNALTSFDDGSGPALFVAGQFVAAGGVIAQNVAKWNGTSWSALGSGVTAEVHALAVFDDGSGPALYAGGELTQPGVALSKWDGTTWSPVGNPINGYVSALQVHDDGSGPALYVAGAFVTAGGVSANRIARWDGSAFSPVGAGLDNTVNALTVFDDGSGSELWVGGSFNAAGGAPVRFVAKWSGSAWSAAGAGVSPGVKALAAFDDGTGAAMHVGGTAFFARWNGSTWTRIQNRGEGVNDTVNVLLAHDDGSGPSLFAGGEFTRGGPTACMRIARWDGTHWRPVGSVLHGGPVKALAVFDDGGGAALYAGGPFLSLGGVSASRIARWDGSSWSEVGSGVSGDAGSFIPSVDALAVFDDGSGPALFAGGAFTTAGGVAASSIAKWDGSNWSALGGGVNGTVASLAVFDDGSGTALYAGGTFDQAGGLFVGNIAKWDGSAWSALSIGIGSSLSPRVEAMAVFDDGSGAALHVGGVFDQAGGTSASCIAKWDGSNWSPLGSGASGPISPPSVDALVAFDDGTGPALYAAGAFTVMDGVSANFVAKWNGSTWSPLGSGITSYTEDYAVANALAAYDDESGRGPQIYLGGSVWTVDGLPSRWIARFGPCEPGLAYCFGDGLDVSATTDCPCGNFGSAGHGCANSVFASGAKLTALGTTSPNTVVFTCDELPNNTLCTLLRGGRNAITGMVFGDGVRCADGPLVNFGQQLSGRNGNPPNTISSGVIADAPGTTRFYQCQYRNPNAGYCDPGLFNVSNGYKLIW